MAKYIIKRIFQSIILLLVVSVVIFFLLYLTGDPVSLLLPPTATKMEIAEVRSKYGFDKPIIEQFLIYLQNLFHGDLGTSLRQQEPVINLITKALPATLILAVTSIIISMFIGIVLGIGSAAKRGGVLEFLSLAFSMIGQAIPVFWLGLMLMIFFAVKLEWLPVSGFESPKYLILPAVTLGLYSAGRITRLVRSEMIDILNKNFIQVAKAKGLSYLGILFKHGFRAVSVNIVTMIGIEFNSLLGGAVVTETVFSWPGIGRLMVNGAITRDFPVTRGVVLIICGLFLIINLVVDILYCVLDPRIHY